MIKLIVITITQLLFFSCSKHIVKPQHEDKDVAQRSAFFEIHDISLLPGEAVDIKIKLYDNNSTFPYLNPIDNENIEIFQGKKLVLAIENLSSYKDKAIILPTITENDLNVYQVSLGKTSKLFASGEFVVNVMDKCQPIIIVDIDHTIANISSTGVVLKNYNEIPAFDYSVDTLTRLSKMYRIIYLTARNDMLMQATRDWLNYLHFPKGPIYFWNFSKHPFNAKAYKKEILKTLNQKFKNIVAGIGDKDSDILAYQSIGLRSYAFNNDDIDLPNVIHVNSWKDFYSDLSNFVKDPRTLCKSQ